MSTAPAAIAAAPALAALLLLGCETPPSSSPPTALLTLSAFRAVYEQDPNTVLGTGLDTVFSKGFPVSYFLSAVDRVRISPTYAQSQQAAYITTDVWVNFSEVWLQPLYVFVKAWDENLPIQNLAAIPWLMGVGDRSAFWSPFFRVYYVVVPPDAPAERYRSVRAITADNLPVFKGGARLMTLVPPAGMLPEGASGILLPKLQPTEMLPNGKVTEVKPRRVWVESEGERHALDFGPDRFEWNERYEITEQPLFFFFVKDSEGTWVPITALPRVSGTGPLFARRPPLAPGNRPAYGSLWRLWSVRLPPSARLFVPPARQGDWEAKASAWSATVKLVENLPPLMPDADPDQHAFKVLLDDSCLRNKGALTKEHLDACPWLDSQEQLERQLPAALFPSEILVACPFVSYAGNPVPPALPEP